MKRLALPFLFSACLGLGACSDAGNQDGGDTDLVQSSGLALDGYIAGALVYADLDEDNRLDSFEPRARTDQYGFFSYRPAITVDGTPIAARDYCSQGPTRHCLRIPATVSTALLRVEGGFDLLTGERFEGALSREVEVSAQHAQRNFTISPNTSVAGAVSTETLDLIDGYSSVPSDANLDGAAEGIEINLVVNRLAARLVSVYSLDVSELPVGVGRNLRGAILREVRALNEAWSTLDATDFTTVIAQLRTRLAVAQASSPNSDSELASDLIAFRTILQQDAGDAGSARANFEARALARSTYARALPGSLAVRGSDSGRFDTLVNGVKGRSDRRRLDLANLTQRFNDSGDTLADLSTSVILEGDQFPSVGGKQLVVTDDSDPQAVKTAALYFAPGSGGETDAGTLTLCLSGLAGLDLGDFGDDSGKLRLTGRWAQPNFRSLILTLTAFGGTFEGSAAFDVRASPSSGPIQIGLTYQDETEVLDLDRNGQTMAEHLATLGSVPSTAADCPPTP